MSKVVLTYIGKGFLHGVPDRDLTASDIDHLKGEGITTETLIQSQLYEEVVPAPLPSHVGKPQPQQVADEKAKE